MYITCRELIDFLDDYINDELDPAWRAKFDEHLAVCPDCINYLESYRRTVGLSRIAFVYSDTPAPANVPAGLSHAIRAARLATT